MSNVKTLQKLLQNASPLPWEVINARSDTVFGPITVPIRIKSKDRILVHEEQGLLYGFNPGKTDKRIIKANVNLMTCARLNTDALLRALMKSVGFDEVRANYLLEYGYKEALQDAGLVEEDVPIIDLT